MYLFFALLYIMVMFLPQVSLKMSRLEKKVDFMKQERSRRGEKDLLTHQTKCLG